MEGYDPPQRRACPFLVGGVGWRISYSLYFLMVGRGGALLDAPRMAEAEDRWLCLHYDPDHVSASCFSLQQDLGKTSVDFLSTRCDHAPAFWNVCLPGGKRH